MMKSSRCFPNLSDRSFLLNRRSGGIHRLSTCQKMCHIERITDPDLLSRREARRMIAAGDARPCRWCWPEETNASLHPEPPLCLRNYSKNTAKTVWKKSGKEGKRTQIQGTWLRLGWRLAVISLLGCGTWMAAGCTRTVYVPVRSHETVVDTVTATLPDSALFRALFECDSNNRVILRRLFEYKGKNANQDIRVDGGRVEVTTRWQTKYVDRIREVRDTVTIVKSPPAAKAERYVPRFFWWCFGIALGTALFAGFRIVTVFRK